MNIRNYLLTAICIASVFFSGCFERREEISINENGDIFIRALLGGDAEEAPQISELPNKGSWKINKWETTTNKEGRMELEIDAEMNIPYGESVPDRYNTDDKTDRGLRFPTTIKTYRKGSRTFYEFTRRYQSRKYNPYEIFNESIDGNLEKKIFDEGIFNVSQKEQTQYLNQLIPAFRLSQLRYIYDVLGLMVFNNDMSQDLRTKMMESARDKVDTTFTPDRFKKILARINEETISKEIDLVTKEMDMLFASVFKNHIQTDDGNLLNKFTKLLDNERQTRAMTDNINGHGFEISLTMPGQIVVTNGIFDGESMESVSWKFSGNDLNDCEYVLHAVSVLDN
ncbi:MAG: hypothetical protein JXR49_10215 [Acidobacteria bacterium]|nr:hypothetical protein [Acidobacteriota bacterium]